MDDKITDWSIYSDDDDECPSFVVDNISVYDKCPTTVDDECTTTFLFEIS